MDAIIYIFTDILSGTTYVAYVIVLVIFIFAIIGFLAERRLKSIDEKNKFAKAINPTETNENIIEADKDSSLSTKTVDKVLPVSQNQVIPEIVNTEEII